MAISRQRKEELIAKYAEELQQSHAVFLTRYQGLSVNQVNELRKKLREEDSSFAVVKNTLMKRALAEANLTGIDDMLEGPVGISFVHGDPPPVAKVLVEFAKDTKVLEVKGGLLGESFLDEEAIKNLAELPPLDVLRAQLLGLISAPATQIAGVVASGVRQVVNVVNAYADSGEGEAAAA